MKISKVTWIFLIIGVILVAGASLGMAHSRQADQQKQLEAKVAQAKAKLALINNNELLNRQNQLNTQIKTYNSQLESAKQKLFSDEDSISATDLLLVTGNNSNVNVVLLASPGFSTQNLAGVVCNTLSVNMEVTGNINDINRFVKELSRQFPTSIINSVSINNGQAPPEVESENPETPLPPELVVQAPSETTASISMVIYEYRDSSSPSTPK